jgi:hypothetical protein
MKTREPASNVSITSSSNIGLPTGALEIKSKAAPVNNHSDLRNEFRRGSDLKGVQSSTEYLVDVSDR